MTTQRIIPGDCIAGLRTLPDASVHCCVTSPPYWGLRDYGHEGQIGLEETPEAYVARMVEVFRAVRRVLRDDGTCWVNLGDSYNNFRVSMNGQSVHNGEQRDKPPGRRAVDRTLKEKDLVGIPWRVAFALQADGWWLRQDIIWHKPNPMPESVTDRCTKAHEYVFLLTKSQRYFYDAEAVSEPVSASSVSRLQQAGLPDQAGSFRVPGKTNGPMKAVGGFETRNKRSVWTVTTKPYSGAHFAVMPADLVEPCIRAGTSEEGCCPHCGAPWERVVERDRQPTRPGAKSKFYAEPPAAEGSPPRQHSGDICGNRDPLRHCTASKTTGWRPSCDCPAHQPVPCTVLDPFAGSGTTLAVAAELGRSGIGCELNPEYIALAERRIKDARASVALFEGAVA